MPKKTKFDYFDAFEEFTHLAVQEAEILIDLLENFTTAEEVFKRLDELHELEHRGDECNHAVFSHAALDFMPPIDREDIVDLAHALDNVLDIIEDVATHMYMYDVRTMPEDALRFGNIIKQSCLALEKAMLDFRNFKKSKNFKQLIVDINTYEEEADVLYRDVIRHLHTVENDEFMHVLVWSRIYGRMERCCDACEHAADIMGTILLKNV